MFSRIRSSFRREPLMRMRVNSAATVSGEVKQGENVQSSVSPFGAE
jgi:hypothetical protein